MNILAVTPFPPQKDGGSTSVYEFFKRMSTQGYNIKVISYLTSHKVSPNLESIGMNLGMRMSFRRGIKFIFNAVKVGKKLNKKYDFDVVYAKNITSPSFVAYFLSKLLRKPLVVHTSGGDIQELDSKQKRHRFSRGMLFFLTKFLRKRVLERATTIIANNKVDFQILNNLGFEEKTVLIRNGVDKERFFSSPKKRGENAPILIFVGRPEREKNPGHILEIANRVKNPLLLIGGSKEEFSNFGELSSNIKVIGITDKIEEYYKESDIFIQTSSSEGLSNALLEAMSSRNVPITYPSGDAIFLIKNGHNGFLCDNTDEIVEKINFLSINFDEYQKISENARKTIEEKFDWSESVKKMNEVFKRLNIKK